MAGTGAGGGTLANVLAKAGKRILLLERGNFLPRELANWDRSRSGRGAGSTRPSPALAGTGTTVRSGLWCLSGLRFYCCGCMMSTIHGTPNWSAHMPNSSPQACLSSGMVTVPPADSFSQ